MTGLAMLTKNLSKKRVEPVWRGRTATEFSSTECEAEPKILTLLSFPVPV